MDNKDFLTVNDYKRHAIEHIEKPFLDFLQLGSGANVSVNANENAYAKYRIRPRYTIWCVSVTQQRLNILT